MGRTNSTYRNHINNFFQQLKPFKKALRKKNKEMFEELEAKAHYYAPAGFLQNSQNPTAPIFLSMILGLQADISDLEERIESLED